MIKIPVFDIKRQNKQIGKELKKAINEVVDSGWYILGPKVEEFENVFAKFIGVKYAVGVASGTDAISLGLLAAGIREGDEVVVPADAYPSVFALTQIGIVPRLVDVDMDTYTIDADKLEAVLTRKTKAILPVHLYGQACDMDKIMRVAKKYKLKVIEDCAQAHGAKVSVQQSVISYQNNNKIDKKPTTFYKKVGSIGDVGCFSFYPTKNLGAFGDGGMVVTDSEEIYHQLKLLRMYGEEKRYESVILGRNSRLDELQAAILLVKLKFLDQWNNQRRNLANIYLDLIQNSKLKTQKYNSKFKNYSKNLQSKTYNLQLPIEASYAKHIYHLFVVRTDRRDELKSYLEKYGIGTAIHYPSPIHFQPSMKYLGYKRGDFPVSEEMSRGLLSLPIYPELQKEEVVYICQKIKAFFHKSS
jgi:dTDP-4-amino-4,6-dideoxygalactose transaminase